MIKAPKFIRKYLARRYIERYTRLAKLRKHVCEWDLDTIDKKLNEDYGFECWEDLT